MMKLFMINLKGFCKPFYVSAEGLSDAYGKLRSSLDKREIGFTKDRCLSRIELIAEEGDYPECEIRFII